MARFQLPLSGDVTQTINPWTWVFSPGNTSFSLFSFDLGPSSNPEVEGEILRDVASYGRQIGRIEDALAVLLTRFGRPEDLSQEEQEALEDFDALMREIQAVKRRHRRSSAGGAQATAVA
ncbi:hypothetical protein [Sinorhizobium sp. BG8]|uniref:hypothetical protein n=1 Tax=Sinorhizobium sp. BG8 TaxID=2613773 RepID=UPI00193CBC4C|nr:hypothetical protein [Sinorhizobium sp. BG8]QRM53148.1 hypothetical protein F3Y30_00130 [Sinorhizobium sp. BG8]QRM56734.1 hypothetical protein F3Y30_21005 [Sinorhizobium sp. BG8]